MRLIDAVSALPDDAVPVVDGGREVTARTLRALAAQVSEASTGGLVAISLPPTAACLAAVAGVQAAGGVPAGINPRLPAAVVAALVARLEPDACIGAEAPAGLLHLAPPSSAARGALSSPQVTRRDDDVGLVVCTSGTTAVPRAHAFTIAALRAVHEAELADDPAGPGVLLGAMPPGNLFMSTRLPSVIARGGRAVLLPSWDAAAALAAVREHGVDTVPGVPTHFADLLAEPDRGERLRRCVIGGAAAPPGMVRALHERFGCEIVLRYSTTETGAICSTGPVIDDDGTVGRPLPGVDIAIEDGRVLVRSRMAARGEWNGALAPAWVDTGDLGVLEDDGRLRLLGRVDDAFTRGGTTVAPGPVEAVLATAPGVTEAVVVGEEDARLGMRSVAFVAGTAKPEDVLEHAREHLAAYLVPDEVRVLGALPRTAAGKPDRRALRDGIAG